MSKLPDFEGLAFFAKVVEERSFAGAARALSTSVATVSRGVARLEERLGARLFNRTSRQIALTEFGTRMAESATRLLQDAEEAENAARELSSSPRGRLRLAVPMSFGLRWVAPLMPEFLRLYPELSVDLRLSDERVDLVGEGFDAALRIAVMPDSSLVARRICPVSPVIVASPGYLARVGRPQTPGDLVERDCLGYAYRARSDVWRFVDAAGQEAVVTPGGRLSVTNVDALIPTVLEGLAVAELPDFIACEYLQSGRLEALLEEWTLPKGGLYFVVPSARTRAAKVKVLGEFLSLRLSAATWRHPARSAE